MNALKQRKAIEALQDVMDTPDSFLKGEEFQRFVKSHLFSKDNYDYLRMTPDYAANKDGFIETSKEPDFKFRSRKSGIEFFVEAKYRSEFYDGAIKWCKPYQMRRYKAMDEKTPIYVVIGVGQDPGSPEHVFLVPLNQISWARLFLSFLRKYEVQADLAVSESTLLSLLKNP